MNIFNIIAVLITITGIFSFINYCYIRLPTTIGVMFIGLLMSVSLICLKFTGLDFTEPARTFLQSIDFNQALMQGMLSYLLFAGALHVNLEYLFKNKWMIGSLATFGVVLSTFLIGSSMWLISGLFSVELSFIYCLIFGALISPTDPIAVLAILKKVGAPKSLETKITGESLFNDGVGVVVFLLLTGVAFGGHEITFTSISFIFVQEAVGGALYGACLGFITFWMLKRVDNYHVEVILTLALVTGGYASASALHLSGPIAIVIAGLMIGNHGRFMAMSDLTRKHLDNFWELIDEILNAVLFVLIGLEVMILTFSINIFIASIISITIVLLARFISVAIPVTLLRKYREFSPHAIKILTWGGLRGAISVALALSLPASPEREIILAITYCIVVFSILAQGLTIGKLIQWSAQKS